MADKPLPSPSYARQLLRFEPETGKLYWRERSAEMFTEGRQSATHNCAIWNGKYAGKEAFTCIGKNGYKSGAIFERRLYAHRVIWAIVHDEWPEHEIDHINGDRRDNRLENLRSVERAENRKNCRKRSDNTSGRTGVLWCEQKGAWQAVIHHRGKSIHLGFFASFKIACAARSIAEKKYGYSARHGR